MRSASDPAQIAALEGRYEAARTVAETRSALTQVARFESAVRNSFAVVSCSIYPLRQLVVESKALYANYQLGTRAQVRKVAEGEFDRHRRTVDAMLFGAYGDQIIYAALSLDGNGLKSYGAYSIILRDVAVSKRASVLEENSYSFVKNHKMEPGHPIPEGYRAPWGRRAELAVAKLADLISPTTSDSDFSSLLLSNGSTRDDDNFMEVHIYGGFDQNAIEAVSGNSAPKRADEKGIATVVKEVLNNTGKKWIEE